MYLLSLLLLFSLTFAQDVHYYIGERVNVLGYAKARELILKASEAGCDGIVGLDQWSKNGDPRTDEKYRGEFHALCQLCDSLGLELRPFVWNGSKYHYGQPIGIDTKAPAGNKVFLWQAFTLTERKFIPLDLSGELAGRLYDLDLITTLPVDVRLFRDTPEQQQVQKFVTVSGQNALTIHSLDGSPYFIYLAPKHGLTRVFVRGLYEREPTALEAPAFDYARPEYDYYNPAVKLAMNPDCTAAFYRVAMRQSLLYWEEFQDEPAISGVWFSLDELAVWQDGERYADLVTEAAWFNYSLWGEQSWGWNDCLGGHNSQDARQTVSMQNEGVTKEAPFLGFAWNESNPTALRKELALFDTGSVGAAVYLGTNNIDSAASAIRDYRCPQVLLFNWEYDKWSDSLEWIVQKIKTK